MSRRRARVDFLYDEWDRKVSGGRRGPTYSETVARGLFARPAWFDEPDVLDLARATPPQRIVKGTTAHILILRRGAT